MGSGQAARRRRDLDNLCKSALDILQHCSVIEDDGHIDALVIGRREVFKNGKLVISIRENI
jgi:crossover junction endodeoxyribonuclease RusA